MPVQEALGSLAITCEGILSIKQENTDYIGLRGVAMNCAMNQTSQRDALYIGSSTADVAGRIAHHENSESN